MTGETHPYIILHPNMRTNPTDQFLVVHVGEWVAVTLGEKEDYAFTSHHPDYPSAAEERHRLNHQPPESSPCPAATPPQTEKKGVSLTRKSTDAPGSPAASTPTPRLSTATTM